MSKGVHDGLIVYVPLVALGLAANIALHDIPVLHHTDDRFGLLLTKVPLVAVQNFPPLAAICHNLISSAPDPVIKSLSFKYEFKLPVNHEVKLISPAVLYGSTSWIGFLLISVSIQSFLPYTFGYLF
jgi:hypothetical protein